MSVLSNRLWCDRRGVSAVELALAMPVLMLMIAGLTEVGNVYYQSNLIERGLRAGTLFAARNDFPLEAGVHINTENLIKRGTTDPTAPLLVPGWNALDAVYAISVENYSLDGDALPVVKVSVDVPYRPLIPGLASMVGLDNLRINLRHEQSRVDD